MQGDHGEPPIDYRTIKGIDPGAQWLLGPGLPYFMPAGDLNASIPFILWPLDDDAARAIEALRGTERFDANGDPLIQILEPNFPRERRVQQGMFYFAIAPGALFDRAAQDPRRDNVEESPYRIFARANKRIQFGLPLRGALAQAAQAEVEAAHHNQAPVVIGIVDDAIAFANARFRLRNNTSRFLSFWIQDNIPGGTPPAGFSYGNELNQGAINTLITNNLHGDWVNEEEIYRSCGTGNFTNPYHKGVAWRIAHGTHVADLAAGYDMSDNRDDRPIIGVQLPVAATAGQSGAGLEPYVQHAIEYIRSRAAAMVRTVNNTPAPVVINFSYATHDGPHDGSSPLESFIDAAITTGAANVAPLQIVLPSGNTAQSRCHARISFRGSPVDLRMRVQPDCTTVTTLQLWLPCLPADNPHAQRVELRVRSPLGDVSAWIQENTFGLQPLQLPDGTSCGQVYYAFAMQWGDRGMFRIDINPTAYTPDSVNDGGSALAPAGLWTIQLQNISLRRGAAIHAWIARNDLLYGYPRRGRQAYFDEADYPRLNAEGRPLDDDPAPSPSPVLRNGMINAIGGGQNALIVGGYRRKDLTLADYSAGGPTPPACDADPDEAKPDAVIVTDASRVFRGLFAAGTRSGSTVAISGTSMGCARLTRLCADELAGGNFPDRNFVALRAAQGEAALATPPSLPQPPPPLPAPRGGGGRIVLNDPVPLYRTRFWLP